MPAEWETHDATWFAWPHNKETWPGKLREIESIWVWMISALHVKETVNVLVNNASEKKQAVLKLKKAGVKLSSVKFYPIPTVDAWLRDTGPIFLTHETRGLAMTRWLFNAWGGKYADLRMDDGLPLKINEFLNIPCFEPEIVLEGGSIDVNGQGLCLTTEQCLLNKNRNPSLSQREIGQCLKNYLGISKMIWLGDGLDGDDTDGHVDDVARFVNPKTVVCCATDDRENKNYQSLKDNHNRLSRQNLNVIKLPLPSKPAGLPASYANFYIGNGAVLVPTFNDPNDRLALDILQLLFPHRKVMGISCSSLILGFGSIHCVTQQQPRSFT